MAKEQLRGKERRIAKLHDQIDVARAGLLHLDGLPVAASHDDCALIGDRANGQEQQNGYQQPDGDRAKFAHDIDLGRKDAFGYALGHEGMCGRIVQV